MELLAIVRNLEGRLVPQNPVGKVCVKQGFESCMLYAKLYITSTINILKKGAHWPFGQKKMDWQISLYIK